ncbi:tryptophan halogenase family protein [Sphingomonas sp. Tas61C01]|uniref:tryptophan halogenase family protein n=1 Tax=Sphingomonas sp. Tas61C01 TaxID=3458297 RepID=UPI00403E7189
MSKVVILGGGTAGWMTAAALSKIMGPGAVAVELVESDEIGTIGVGEATIPQLLHFNALLEIDEDEFVRATSATYKLGIEFVGWKSPSDRYFHPFGSYGLPMLGVDFQHFWLKGRQHGERSPLDSYSLAAAAARAGRFARPVADQPRSPLSRTSYAFQFDAGLYAGFLRRFSQARGVSRTEGKVVDVVCDPETGLIRSLVLADGRAVSGDLFVDCSGFRGRLIEQVMRSGYVDWTPWLPCDRAVAVPCARVEDPAPFTRATARAAGWQWRIPLQHRTGNGYVYSSRFVSDDEAVATLLDGIDGEALDEPRRVPFASGHRSRPWIGNVVAIGLAAGFLEPLESTGIHLVQSAIARLMTLFPTSAFDCAESEAFNRQTVQEYECIRDFLVLHYRLNGRQGEAFWRHCSELPVPEGLRRKLELFGANGRILRESDELFTETSWLAVMAGQGVEPRGYHPVLDVLSPRQTLARLADVREVNRRAVSIMPTHADFLAGRRHFGDPPS